MAILSTSADEHYLLIDPDHLRLNRDGDLSAQQRRLAWSNLWWRRFVWFCIGSLGVVIGSLLIAGGGARLWPELAGLVAPVFLIMLIAGMVWMIRTQLLPTLRGSADVWLGRLDSVDGRLRWRRRGYVFVPEGQSEPLPFLHAVAGSGSKWIEAPPPGDYRAFVLSRSRIVVALEPTVKPGHLATAGLAAAILDSLGTDDAGLAEIRRGVLVGAAKMRLLRKVGWRMLAVVGLLMWLVSDWSRLRAEALWLSVVLMACGVAIFWMVNTAVQLLRDWSEAGVVQIQASVQKRFRGGSVSGVFPERMLLPETDEPPFMVSAKTFAAVVAGIDYRIFYAPRSRLLVAMEPVDDFI